MTDQATTTEELPAGPGMLRRFLTQPGAPVGLALTLTLLAMALFAPWLTPGNPFGSVADPFLSPSFAHPMGTDDLGRDLFRAVVHGARTSTLVMLAVVAISTPIGVAVGGIAGYRGGLLDDVLMRITELFQAVPRFFLAVLVIALFGAGIDNLIFVLAFTSWPWLARIVRSETLSLRRRDFVEAARAVGATNARILVRHVLPSLAPSILVVASLTAGRVILLEASLSFLGLGDPNAISWGYLVNNAQRFLRIAWWMSVFPGAAIILAVLGLNLVSDAITELSRPAPTFGYSTAGGDRTDWHAT